MSTPAEAVANHQAQDGQAPAPALAPAPAPAPAPGAPDAGQDEQDHADGGPVDAADGEAQGGPGEDQGTPTAEEYNKSCNLAQLKEAYAEAIQKFTADDLPRVQGKDRRKAHYIEAIMKADQLGEWSNPLLTEDDAPAARSDARVPRGRTTAADATTPAAANRAAPQQSTPTTGTPATAAKRVAQQASTPATEVKRLFGSSPGTDVGPEVIDFMNGGADIKRGRDWIEGPFSTYLGIANRKDRMVIAPGGRALQLLNAAKSGEDGYYDEDPNMVRVLCGLKRHLLAEYPDEAREVYDKIGRILRSMTEVPSGRPGAESDDQRFADSRILATDPKRRSVAVLVSLAAVMYFADHHIESYTCYVDARHITTTVGALYNGVVKFGTPNPEHVRHIGERLKATKMVAEGSEFDFRQALAEGERGCRAPAPQREIGQKQERAANEAAMRCYRCRQTGHRAVSCPHEARVRTQPAARTTLSKNDLATIERVLAKGNKGNANKIPPPPVPTATN